MGLDWSYTHPREVFDEMRMCMDSIAGITWDRLERESSVTYPCVKEGDPGDPVVFIENFPTATGRAKFVPADLISAAERPDAEYPMVLITGRQLEHWHTGSMTRRAAVLDYIEPEPVASVHPLDLEELGVEPGGTLTIESRRGEISLYARADDGTPRGAVFVPFCYYEAAANMLTNPALDPFGKIPEFKYCAVKVTAGGTHARAKLSFGGGVLLPDHQPAASNPSNAPVVSWGPPSGGPTRYMAAGLQARLVPRRAGSLDPADRRPQAAPILFVQNGPDRG